MIGQPSPSAVHAAPRAAPVALRLSRCALLCILLGCLVAPAQAQDNTVRVRISWGGGQARKWAAKVSLSEGSFAALTPIGSDADGPGSMWVEFGQLHIAQKSPHTYDGLDVDLANARGGQLSLTFTPIDPPGEPVEVQAAVSQLAAGDLIQSLDDRQNRLHIHRGPADRLRVKLDRDHLVFKPAEPWRFEVQPELLGIPGGTKLQLRLQLSSARDSNQLWSQDRDLALNELGSAPASAFELPLPADEGAYDLVISVWPQSFPLRLARKHPLIERRVQLVVVSEAAPPPTAVSTAYQQLGEIDPLQSNWLTRLPNLPLISGGPKGGLGNGRSERVQHPLGPMLRLTTNRGTDEPAWEAYPLPVGNPHQPHILEVEYPAGEPQNLGISIVEPNAAGAIVPVNVDSGVLVTHADSQAPHMARHRLVFWPRTRSPLALLTNLRADQPALFGRLRVLTGPAHLERAIPPSGDAAPRLFAAYLSRPLFTKSFSATEARDELSGRSLDDWVTFYQGGTRLVEYLHHVGYNSLMLGVFADGSALYPSRLLQPSLRYDSGTLLDAGQDPIRKDALELLLRLFDREKLQLIPSLQFTTPLPALEEQLRSGPEASAGIELVGPDGVRLLDRYPPRRGSAPYYNPLNPRVQDAMLAIVDEVAQRYARHPSFSGLAVELSGRGYAQLPGVEWGLDDETIGQFERGAGVRLPTGDRAERVAAILGKHRAAWIKWRTAQMTALYARIEQRVAAARPDARLYLSCAESLDSPAARQAMRPALPRRTSARDLMLELGIDAVALVKAANTVLLQPHWPGAHDAINAGVEHVEFETAAEAEGLFADVAAPSNQFFHEPREVRLPSFDQKSPFRDTFMLLLAQPALSEDENRRRFAHSLAMNDAAAMFDGGWLLPRGQEQPLADLIAVYRALPAGRFNTVSDKTHPVTIRTLSLDNQTWIYMVNDSPWPASISLGLSSPAGAVVEALGNSPLPSASGNSGTWTWNVDFRPYDIVGVKFSAGKVQLKDPRVSVGGNAVAVIERAVRDLNARAATLSSPPAWNVLQNPGFEADSGWSQPVPGWTVVAADGSAAELDTTTTRGGVRALKLNSGGAVVSVASAPFDAPPSGRLALRAWLRIADGNRQPVVRLSVEGYLGTQPYSRATIVGRGHHPLNANWTQYEFTVPDLPLAGLKQVRVRFDLLEAGEAWIDDVQLFHLQYLVTERVELQKILHLVGYDLEQGEVADCSRLLEGYWPKFLQQHVPAVPEVAALPAPPSNSAQKPPKSGMLDRLNRMNPFR